MATWQNFLDNFSGQAEFQAQKQGEQIQAEIDYYNSPEGQRAAQIGGGIMAAMLPIPGSKWAAGSQIAKPIINKTYGAVGKDMIPRIIPPLTKTGRSRAGLPPLRSGARVGQDAIRSQKDLKNMDPLERLLIPPLTKTGRQLTTKRGPRGPINIETPAVTPKAPPPGTRNTGGLSETDKAMIDFIKPTAIGNRRNRPIKDEWLISKSNRNRAKEVDKVKWNKDQIPNKSDRILQRRPANAEEVEIIKDLTKKGFYDKPQTISSKIKELQPNPYIRQTGRWKGREAIPVGKGTGQPAPSRGAIPKSYGPRLTEKEGLESLVKIKEGKNWFVDPKTLRTYEFRVGGGTQPRGFYTNSNPPSYVGRAVKDIESNWLKNSGIDRKNFDRRYYERLGPAGRKAYLDRIKAIQDKQKGIMNTPSARSTVGKVKSTNTKELTNRRNALRSEEFRLNSMRSQGEATQADMNKYHRIKAEIEAIEKLLK